MIKSLRLKNFKCFKDIELQFKNLNLLTGINSSGKSSIIQSLLFIKQNFEKLGEFPDINKVLELKNYSDFSFEKLNTKGKYIELGATNNLLYENAEDDTIEFTLEMDNEGKVKITTEVREINSNELFVKSLENKNFKTLVEEESFSYLSAERIVPKAQYGYSKEDIAREKIGNKGEYTVHYLAENANKNLKIPSLKENEAKSNYFGENVSRWMEKISSGIDIITGVNEELRYSYLKYSYGGKEYLPQNIGFGITYTLPVVVNLLKAKKGDLIIIENPESHLHPAAQVEIARLCCKVAAQGVQIFIETHSDHFLNGVRVGIKEEEIKNTDTQIYFFTREGDYSIAEKINVDLNGKVDKWPKGFFDEWDIQLEKLLW